MRVHFIKDKENIILYLPDLLKFFRINSTTESIIKSIIALENKESIINKYKINEEQYNSIQKLMKSSENLNYETFKDDKLLYKLTLNITNNCNLSCKYCYANGGIYNSQKSRMKKEVLKKSLDFFTNKYNNIQNIQLFGGEPTLNLDAIDFVGNYFDDKYKNNKINFKPIISIVTNGTCANDRFIELINKYNIKITVSIDGPAFINDKTRLLNNGQGSSKFVMNNIKKLKSSTTEPSSAEATFTQYHVDSNVEVLDVVKFIKNELNIQNVHIVPVNCDKNKDFYLKDRESFMKSIPEIINNKNKIQYKNTYMLVDRIVKNIIYKTTNNYICSAGIGTFSVSTKGDIYPCFMLTDVKKYKLGNIMENVNESNNMLNIYEKSNKYNLCKCRECFNNTLCHGCLGINYFNTGDAFTTNEEECEFMKKLTENIILALSKIN